MNVHRIFCVTDVCLLRVYQLLKSGCNMLTMPLSGEVAAPPLAASDCRFSDKVMTR
jgi:hypothetical protein